MPSLTCYTTGHIHSEKVMGALARGLGTKPVGLKAQAKGAIALYGFLRGSEPVLRKAQAEGRDWWYLDNGYFRPGHYNGFYRLTRNAYQHDGRGESDGRRFRQLGIQIQPWRKRSRHILVCPPGQVMASHRGFGAEQWMAQTMSTLREHTEIPVRVRHKGSGVPLARDLEGCHALVTALSNTAVEALIAGVPVFCTHDCAAASMGKSDLREIEDPHLPADRERWAGVLADHQWTLDELRAGLPWQG